jgi:hypothetical protein
MSVERRHREEAARCVLELELTPDEDLGKNAFAEWLNTGNNEHVILMGEALQLTAQALANTEAAIHARYAGLVHLAKTAEDTLRYVSPGGLCDQAALDRLANDICAALKELPDAE